MRFLPLILIFLTACNVPSVEEQRLTSTKRFQLASGLSGFNIIQNNVIVGHIYVPPRPSEVTEYDEHWVLLPNYVYPGPKHPQLKTTIVLGTKKYPTKQDFFQHVPFPQGSRYILVKSHESNQLPTSQKSKK